MMGCFYTLGITSETTFVTISDDQMDLTDLVKQYEGKNENGVSTKKHFVYF